jgi:hypothetical protein
MRAILTAVCVGAVLFLMSVASGKLFLSTSVAVVGALDALDAKAV